MMAHRIENVLMRTVLVAVVFLLAAGGMPGTVRAQDCQVPLFVQQALIGANVMILADNSGSMNAAVYHLDYDASTVYSGTFNTYSQYYIGSDGWREPIDFNSGWPAWPSVYLVNSDNGYSGRYFGNYLNWLYYHATNEQRLSAPTETRIQVLKQVLRDIVNRSERLSFGLTIFDHDDGGHVIAPCGVDHADLVNTVNGISANTWTPLGESMQTVLEYFMDDSADAPIQASCQNNFCLVVTDGLPTMDVDVAAYIGDADGDGRDPGSCTSIGAPYSDSYDCSDYFDDVAYYMAHEDLRPDLEGDQHVYSYVVGFHENGQLLQDAAVNGDGLFFNAENAVEMVSSIEFAIQDILRRISAGSAVAVVSTERGTNDRLYRGKFMPIDWTGFLECYELPYEDGNPAIWEAGSLLQNRSVSSREIFTEINGSVKSFSDNNAANLMPYLGVSTVQEAEDLINWGRGEDVPGYRLRPNWILGDIVHSTPVVVGAPTAFTSEESYHQFYASVENRRKMVYVGANDGMLHAFDADDGEEVWAFVPEFALPQFKAMADSGYCHTYTCDQTVSVKDVQVNGIWRSILITGGREGGGSIFALDITDPDSPDVLWQRDLDNGKPYESEVEIVSIGGEAVALVGSGLDEDTQHCWLYAYRISSGELIGSVELEDTALRNKATRPATVDVDLDGEVDLVYIADLSSRVWRFATDGDPDPGNWDRSLLFESNREITAPLVASYGENGEILLYFGTGAYLTEDDMMTANSNSFICVKDLHDETALDLCDLVDQTDDINSVQGSRGWYVNLWNTAGERVTQEAAVVAGTVIFTSFAPTLDACVSGGSSYLYQMAYDTGGLPDSDDMEDPEDRSVSLGDGIASHPVVDLAQGAVVVQSSDASISITPIAGAIQRLTVRSWQEDYDSVYIPQGAVDGDIQ